MSVQFPSAVKEISASARLVYAALDGAGPLTREEIEDRTGVARRTANAALATLREKNLATAESHPTDGRRRLYSLTENNPSPNRG